MGWRVLLVGALMVQLVVLYTPGSAVPSMGIPGIDKVIHLTIFAVPALAITQLTRARWPLLLLAAHGLLSELVQHWLIPHRGGDWRDLLTDLAGVALGAAVGWSISRLRLRRGDGPAGRPAEASPH
ncbi:MAG: VanZ family protein [Brooklawnia sp.]|jgi:hypothetical protein